MAHLVSGVQFWSLDLKKRYQGTEKYIQKDNRKGN